MADEATTKPSGWQRPKSAKDVDKQLQRNSLYDLPGGAGVDETDGAEAAAGVQHVGALDVDDGAASGSSRTKWWRCLIPCSRPTGSLANSRGSVAMDVRMPELHPMAA